MRWAHIHITRQPPPSQAREPPPIRPIYTEHLRGPFSLLYVDVWGVWLVLDLPLSVVGFLTKTRL